MSKLAVILLRGMHDMNREKLSTLKMLNLAQKHACSVVENNISNRGMLNRIKDYVTFGEIDEATLKMMIEKRAEKSPSDPKKTKKFFRLNSPKDGFERKGIKWPVTKHGATGYRGEKINELIKRMI